MAPDTLPPAYINFLNRHGGAPNVHLAAVRVRLSKPLPCECLHFGRSKDWSQNARINFLNRHDGAPDIHLAAIWCTHKSGLHA